MTFCVCTAFSDINMLHKQQWMHTHAHTHTIILCLQQQQESKSSDGILFKISTFLFYHSISTNILFSLQVNERSYVNMYMINEFIQDEAKWKLKGGIKSCSYLMFKISQIGNAGFLFCCYAQTTKLLLQRATWKPYMKTWANSCISWEFALWIK